MPLQDLYMGYRPFSDHEGVLSAVRRSKHYDADMDDIDAAKTVQLLNTSKQKTYLIGAGKRIYKVLDDRREPRPKVIWSRGIDEVFTDGTPAAALLDYNERADNLLIAAVPGKMNFVSKELFTNIGVMDAVASLADAG